MGWFVLFRFVGQNFVMLSDHEKFVDLSFELFYQLLADDYFIAATEDLIFKTIRRWVQVCLNALNSQLRTFSLCALRFRDWLIVSGGLHGKICI